MAKNPNTVESLIEDIKKALEHDSMKISSEDWTNGYIQSHRDILSMLEGHSKYVFD